MSTNKVVISNIIETTSKITLKFRPLADVSMVNFTYKVSGSEAKNKQWRADYAASGATYSVEVDGEFENVSVYCTLIFYFKDGEHTYYVGPFYLHPETMKSSVPTEDFLGWSSCTSNSCTLGFGNDTDLSDKGYTVQTCLTKAGSTVVRSWYNRPYKSHYAISYVYLDPESWYRFSVRLVDSSGNASAILTTLFRTESNQLTLTYNLDGVLKRASVFYNDGGTVKRVIAGYRNEKGEIVKVNNA